MNRSVHRFTTAILVVLIAVVIVLLWREIIPVDWLASLGYRGIFAISLINGIAPVAGPSQVATFFVAQKLNPLGVGVAAGLGGSIGEIAGYFLGYSVRSSQSEHIEQKLQRIINWRPLRISREHSFVPLCVLAAIPNPFFDPASALAGSLRIGFVRYFAPVLLGKTLRHVAIAYAGSYSVLLSHHLFVGENTMTEFLSSGWFVLSVLGIAVLVWSVRSLAESEPDPFVLNLTFFAFAGQCVLTAELARHDKVNAIVLGLALLGLMVLIGQIFVFRSHVNKTTDYYKTLLQIYKPDQYTETDIERWAEIIVRITGVDFWPQLYKGLSSSFGSGFRGRRRSQALTVLSTGQFKCGQDGITAEALTVPEDARRWPWRWHAVLFFLSWVVFIACIQVARKSG